MLRYCEFCNMRAELLCDGKLEDGSTCDKSMCRRCARMVARLHKFSEERGRYCDTKDLCPDCVEAEREIYEKAVRP